jgi:hypothetical protein
VEVGWAGLAWLGWAGLGGLWALCVALPAVCTAEAGQWGSPGQLLLVLLLLDVAGVLGGSRNAAQAITGTYLPLARLPRSGLALGVLSLALPLHQVRLSLPRSTQLRVNMSFSAPDSVLGGSS